MGWSSVTSRSHFSPIALQDLLSAAAILNVSAWICVGLDAKSWIDVGEILGNGLCITLETFSLSSSKVGDPFLVLGCLLKIS